MRWQNWLVTCASSLILVGASEPADSQANLRQQVLEQVRQIATHKLVQELSLDDATATKVVPIVNDYIDRLAEARRQARGVRRQLGDLLRSDHPDQAQLGDLSNSLLQVQANVRRAQDEGLASLKQVLTPEQFAHLLVAFPQINRAVTEEILEAIQGHFQR